MAMVCLPVFSVLRGMRSHGAGHRALLVCAVREATSLVEPRRAHPDQRDAPSGAVIEGRAKRYKPEDGPEATQTYTPAQARRARVQAHREAAAPAPPPGAHSPTACTTSPEPRAPKAGCGGTRCAHSRLLV
jgi:hypothetical protein